MISSPVPSRPACVSPCCPWRACCYGRSACCRRRTLPPPGRSPSRPATFAWQPTAYDSSTALPFAVDDVEPHTTKRWRGQSRSARRPSRDTRGATNAAARRVWSPIAEASGGARLAGSRRFPAQQAGLLLAQQAGLLRNLNTIKADAKTRRDEHSEVTRTAPVFDPQPAGCRLASASLRAARPRLGQPPSMIGWM